MEYKKSKAPVNTITRDIHSINSKTGNIFETAMIIAKRSNQIGQEIKQELNSKLEEFASYTDNLEEIFENREQIEISQFYERMPKATLIATQEWTDNLIYYRKTEETTDIN